MLKLGLRRMKEGGKVNSPLTGVTSITPISNGKYRIYVCNNYLLEIWPIIGDKDSMSNQHLFVSQSVRRDERFDSASSSCSTRMAVHVRLHLTWKLQTTLVHDWACLLSLHCSRPTWHQRLRSASSILRHPPLFSQNNAGKWALEWIYITIVRRKEWRVFNLLAGKWRVLVGNISLAILLIISHWCILFSLLLIFSQTDSLSAIAARLYPPFSAEPASLIHM